MNSSTSSLRSARALAAVLGLVASLVLTLALAQEPSPQSLASGLSPVIVDTPSAPHPKARVRAVDFDTGVIRFDWLDAEGQPVDSGNSLAVVTVTGDTITNDQKAILAAGITAATAAP